MFATSYRLGIERIVAPDELRICVHEDADEGDVRRALLSAHLAETFGCEVDLAVGIPSLGRPYWKPVLEVLTRSGEVLAFAKMGWNEVTRRALETERNALIRVGEAQLHRVRVPGVLGQTVWRGMEISLTEPLPKRVRRFHSWGQPPLEATWEVVSMDGVRTLTLGESGYLTRWLTSLPPGRDNEPDREAHRLAEAFAAYLLNRHGDVEIPFGRCHGDWAPWNLARLNDELYVLDWENSGNDAPIGFDVVNFLFFTSYVKRNRRSHDAMAALHRSEPFLRRLGLRPPVVDLVPSLYVLQSYIAHERAVAEGGVPDPSLRRTLLDAMRSMVG